MDIAKRKHVARAQDFRGIEYGKALIFTNDKKGFECLIQWIEAIAQKNNKTNLIIGMEPTGHYWFNLAYFLRKNDIKVVIVNPMHVKKSKELDDNSPTKNDIKDAKVIAQLVKDGRYTVPNMPEGIFAQLRVCMEIKETLSKNLNAIKVNIKRWFDKYFPEFCEVFKDWEGKAALVTLKNFPFPQDIERLGELKIVEMWKREVKRAVGVKRAKRLVNAARRSVGIKEGIEMARYQLKYLLEQYELLNTQVEEIIKKIETLLDKVPGAKEIASMNGIGTITVAGFFSEVGDINNYEHPKQIQKLAGLNLKENSSGEHKGQTTITKRGRRKLRSLLFKVIMPLVAKNEEFKTLHKYYTTREKNPLKKKQSLIVLCCKLIRVFYAMAKKKVTYNPDKLMKDIKHPINKGIAA